MNDLRHYVRNMLMEDKRGRVKKMGFPSEFVNMLHDFHPPWTHKYADWMASQLLQDSSWKKVLAWHDQEPVPNKISLSGFNNTKLVPGRASLTKLDWLTAAWEENGYREKFETIFQWLDSKGGGPKISKMTLDQAYKKAWLHPALMQSEEEGELKLQLRGGWRWVDLQVSYCEAEAEAMGHCADDSSGNLWTLRDKKGYPKVTCTVNQGGVITQMKGRNNSVPKEEYHPQIVALLSFDEITGINTEEDYDFHWNDLSEENQEKVMEANPNFEVDSTEGSTVEILREGDVEAIRTAEIFDNSIDLHPSEAKFIVWASDLEVFFDKDSQGIVSHILNGHDFEDLEYYYELWGDDHYRKEREREISEPNKSAIMAYVQRQHAEWVQEWVEAEGEPPDFNDVYTYFVVEWPDEDTDLTEAVRDAWAETIQEHSTKAVRHALLNMLTQNQTSRVRDYYGRTTEQTSYAVIDSFEIESERRFKIGMSYDRIANYVEIHHPGTPMGASDIITMIGEAERDYGTGKSAQDLYDYGWKFDEDDFNTRLQSELARLMK